MLRVLGSLLIILHIVNTVTALKCFHCDNHLNPACGVYFKPYQFRAVYCPGPDYKCALQRQRKKDDGWIGIVRVCYQSGSLPGINETNGCRNWTNDMHGYTAYYCFCDTDYCNSATKYSGLLSFILLIPIYFVML